MRGPSLWHRMVLQPSRTRLCVANVCVKATQELAPLVSEGSATLCWELLGSKRRSLGSWTSIIIVFSLAWQAAEKWLRPSVSYDKPTEINTIFYIVLESDLSSLGKHKGAHLISPALLSKSVLISPWLGWIYNAENKDKCRRFKRACSWTLEVPLNRLGTSKCLLIYSWFLFSFFVFFFSFPVQNSWLRWRRFPVLLY